MRFESPGGDQSAARSIGYVSLISIVALLVVGSVSSGVLRHLVQTSPSWAAVYLGLRRRPLVKWTALPGFIFWLFIVVMIWLYLLGLSSPVRGHFSPIEIAMTIVVGIASAFGILRSFQVRSDLRWVAGAAIFVAFVAIQLLAFRLSLIPGISNH
jgi:hypothetical protein